MYGDEESGTPPDMLYDRLDAEEALRDAEYVSRVVVRLFEETVRRIRE